MEVNKKDRSEKKVGSKKKKLEVKKIVRSKKKKLDVKKSWK